MDTRTLPAIVTTAEALEVMLGAQRSITRAVADGDLDAVMDHFADDARMYPEGLPGALTGREQIRTYYTHLFDIVAAAGATLSSEFDPAPDVEPIGDLILDSGTATVVITHPDGHADRRSSKELVVWRHFDGKWRIIRYMANNA
ncbi:YybH family protein [Nocardia pseudovaccinii]|uniref:YybH family protein n=1 Tax=Nocardia pseudovaccinii TaxID=189540 RepID=UPI0007A525B8|nr:DUF4440 domain-containing protein [Nocardia pseudovaccinii]